MHGSLSACPLVFYSILSYPSAEPHDTGYARFSTFSKRLNNPRGISMSKMSQKHWKWNYLTQLWHGLMFQWWISHTCSRLVLSASGSALTLHATSSCAVEDATCFALEISFSSEAIPCTSELADSTRLCVAAATRRAAEMRPSDHWPSSELVRGRRLTCAQVKNSG